MLKGAKDNSSLEAERKAKIEAQKAADLSARRVVELESKLAKSNAQKRTVENIMRKISKGAHQEVEGHRCPCRQAGDRWGHEGHVIRHVN